MIRMTCIVILKWRDKKGIQCWVTQNNEFLKMEKKKKKKRKNNFYSKNYMLLIGSLSFGKLSHW